jgi:hypothetical protein
MTEAMEGTDSTEVIVVRVFREPASENLFFRRNKQKGLILYERRKIGRRMGGKKKQEKG